MFVRTLTAGLLLAALSVAPALAQDEVPAVDLVSAIFIGFGDGATVQVGGGQTAVITQDGPGQFHGTTSDGADFTFAATEGDACNFTGTFTLSDQTFAIAFDAGKIETISFNDAEPMEGFTRYMVVLTGPDGMVESVDPDGTRRDGGKQSPIGTSLTQDELDAAAADLLERCKA